MVEDIAHRIACEDCSDQNFNKNDEFRGLFWDGTNCGGQCSTTGHIGVVQICS